MNRWFFYASNLDNSLSPDSSGNPFVLRYIAYITFTSSTKDYLTNNIIKFCVRSIRFARVKRIAGPELLKGRTGEANSS